MEQVQAYGAHANASSAGASSAVADCVCAHARAVLLDVSHAVQLVRCEDTSQISRAAEVSA